MGISEIGNRSHGLQIMPPKSMPVVPLSEMANGQEADLFALMTSKEQLTTREGKPYFKVGFRDADREVSFPIWDNSPWATDCRTSWTPGLFYKLRAVYRDTNYGPQLDIRKIRETVDADTADGFDPAICLPSTRFDPEAMLGELLQLAEKHVENAALRGLVVSILSTNREKLLVSAAARHHHHAFSGGLLEHTLSVTRNAVFLAEKYARDYPDMEPPLDKGLVAAGAILHDVGKVRELESTPTGASYTPEGELVGHIQLGRDMVREAAAGTAIDADTLLRLEHLILSHQRLPEWGSPKPPMTPEALLVHYADDVDAKYHMMYAILRDDNNPGPLTSS
ncbi:MAG: HD domain-containing protein, partial [Planctomycetes bacterium]|nr:HD domain-containing protein [Planctomycetota bacterium]